MRLSRVAVALVALFLSAGLVLGVLSGAFAAITRSTLDATGLWHSTPASRTTPGPTPTSAAGSGQSSPTPTATAPAMLVDVLPAAQAGPTPNPLLVTRAVEAVPDSGVGSSYSGAVVEAESGKVLYRHRAGSAYVPASTMKVLTTTAALSLLGPEHRFETTVVSGSTNQIVLVGGGDPYLSRKKDPERASVASLAAATARALRAQGKKEVGLRYDASLFSGPAWNPTWPSSYADQVSRISALWVDEGRISGSPGPRVSDPAREAARAFAVELRRNKITVTGLDAGRAPAGATVLASAVSMPLERIVEKLLLASDNDAAEVVFRQAAIAAELPGSFSGGRRAVRAELKRVGVWEETDQITDGSGLSRNTKVSADTLVAALRLAIDEQQPKLRGVATGLPVAGVEGSLRIRFFEEGTLAGRGVVRAKTGTLRKVHALAGYLRAADGTMLVYAFVVNNPANDYKAVVWLDKVTTVLSRCGCR